MGNCVGSKGVKKDPKVLTEEEIKLLLDNTTLTRAQIVALHHNFLKECPSGKLTKKDFVKLFKEVHPSDNKKEKADKFCEYVFKVIDTNNLGYISFQDFVLCFSLTSHGDFKQKCEFAFKLYDLDKDGKISKKEMTQVLTALYDLSGITDRKGENAPAKKVDEIFRAIHAKSADPEIIAALAAEEKARAAKEKKPKEKKVLDKAGVTVTVSSGGDAKAPKEKKSKEQIKEEKEREKAAKEAEKKAKAEKAKAEKEAKAREAKEKKERAAAEKAAAKDAKAAAKPAKEAKPAKAGKAGKPTDYITKEQFIDACNTDETLKKLFVDAVFSQQADQSMLEAKVDDIAGKLNAELPSLSVSAPKVNVSGGDHKTIHISAPKVTSHSSSGDADAKFVSTTTTRVTPDSHDKAADSKTAHAETTVTTTTTRVLPDGRAVTTTEEKHISSDPANSDSDQTHYSEHTEYVNVNNAIGGVAGAAPSHDNSNKIAVELSTDGVKVHSDKDGEEHKE